MLSLQLGAAAPEGAVELARQWKGGYRGGAPDFIAAEPTIRPYHYNQSDIYTGVIGLGPRKWVYDPNLALDVPPNLAYNITGNLGEDGMATAAPGLTRATKLAIGVGVALTVIGGGTAAILWHRRRRA